MELWGEGEELSDRRARRGGCAGRSPSLVDVLLNDSADFATPTCRRPVAGFSAQMPLRHHHHRATACHGGEPLVQALAGHEKRLMVDDGIQFGERSGSSLRGRIAEAARNAPACSPATTWRSD